MEGHRDLELFHSSSDEQQHLFQLERTRRLDLIECIVDLFNTDCIDSVVGVTFSKFLKWFSQVFNLSAASMKITLRVRFPDRSLTKYRELFMTAGAAGIH